MWEWGIFLSLGHAWVGVGVSLVAMGVWWDGAVIGGWVTTSSNSELVPETYYKNYGINNNGGDVVWPW